MSGRHAAGTAARALEFDHRVVPGAPAFLPAQPSLPSLAHLLRLAVTAATATATATTGSVRVQHDALDDRVAKSS